MQRVPSDLAQINRQGRFSYELQEALGLDQEQLEIVQLQGEYNLLKGGIICADALVAASLSYLDEMSEAYAESDLVLSRAGATTCAELAAAGRPSVLVPLPIAGGHQKDNAEMMERAGAAVALPEEELTGEHLARVLTDLMSAPGERQQMAGRARALARPGASKVIAERLLKLAQRSGGRAE